MSNITKIKYGMFGELSIDRDEDGFIERLVIVQESGLYAGAAPAELRITDLIPHNDEDFGKQYTALKNRKTDLPYFLTKVKIKITDKMIEVTDEDVLALGLDILDD